MISRKKNIILIQITIFLIATFLLYNTYRDKDGAVEEVVKIKTTSDPNANNFTDIEYSGFDLSGNRYVLRAGTADFKTEAPESINIKNVVANFYLKDNSLLKVVSNEGLYNNETFDMSFKEDVKASSIDSA